jgi:beta-N-acetylhexosaminidase
MPKLERLAAKMICIGFDGFEVTDDARRLIDRGVGAICLFKRNFHSGQQFADLCANLKQLAGDRPLAICIDHEGGRVVRLGEPFTPIPSMRAIGATGDAELARQVGQIMGRELRAANVDWNFAPVLDVDTNPANPVIASRSFGRDADVVSRMGVAMIQGIQTEGVAACGKHFPGHGDTSQDSHVDLPRLPHAMSRLEQVELPPFRAAIAAGVASIMTAHVKFEAIDPTVPATMSPTVLLGVLRDQMKFRGVIVSDDLEMKALTRYFAPDEIIDRGTHAGIDLFTIAHSPEKQNGAIDELIRMVEQNVVMRNRLEASNERLDRLFAAFVQPARTGPLSELIGCAMHRNLVARVEETAKEHDPTVFIR